MSELHKVAVFAGSKEVCINVDSEYVTTTHIPGTLLTHQQHSDCTQCLLKSTALTPGFDLPTAVATGGLLGTGTAGLGETLMDFSNSYRTNLLFILIDLDL